MVTPIRGGKQTAVLQVTSFLSGHELRLTASEADSRNGGDEHTDHEHCVNQMNDACALQEKLRLVCPWGGAGLVGPAGADCFL